MKGERLGEFEELVLLTVCQLYNKAYGVTIRETLIKEAERSISIGALYAALDRLERKGYVTSWVGEATNERGGRRKRFYQVTGVGMEAVAEMRRIREKLWQNIEALGLQRG